MSKLVYLAGPITGCSWEEATAWRNNITEQLKPLGVECLSPLRAKTYLEGVEKIADHYSDFVLSAPKGITTRDRWDSTRCDVLFVNLLGATRVSIGTVLEIGWAYGKPIVIAMENDNIHRHSMITESAGYIVETLEDGVHVLKALFN